MKNLVILLLMVSLSCVSLAQERKIRMPESPTPSNNMAEDDENSLWCAIEVGGGATVMENKKNVALVGASYTGGFRFNQYMKLGIGIGILYYPNNDNVRDTKNHLAMPLFINARGNILSDATRHTVPYWSLNTGVTFPDGLFLTPTIGLRIGEKRNAFLIGISYSLRHLKSYSKNTQNYSGVLFKLGYEF